MAVNSYLPGEACFDPNIPYTPQARMYLDAQRIISDGLAVRDGVHVLKVYDTLPLDSYLLLTVFGKNVALPTGEQNWTPTSFSNKANDYFYKYMKQKNIYCNMNSGE